jgi:hypothetical protein
MLIAAHQPLFIPWIGFFDKISKVDLFIIVDDVQFTSSGWIRRNTIKSSQGPQSIVIPLKKRILLEKRINEIQIDNQMNAKWKQKHLTTFQLNYGKARYFQDCFGLIKNIYDEPYDLLSEFNIRLIKSICEYLKINTKILTSTEIQAGGNKTELIIDLCFKSQATSFMLGMGASNDYADKKKIESYGITLVNQNFKHPTYNQLFGVFTPNLSILDLLFNEGPNSTEIIKT